MRFYREIERQKRDKAAENYDEWYITTKGLLFDLREKNLFARFVQGHCKDKYLLLDVGSGTGRITEVIAPFIRKVVALDFSMRSLQMLRVKNIANCISVCACASCIPFKDETFDLVISCQVLQHMLLPELLGCLREVHRTLKPGGLFAFSNYNLHYWRYKGVFEIGDEAAIYCKRFSIGYIRYLAATTSFRVKYIGFYKSFPLRLLKRKFFLILDRGVCAIPFINRFISAYVFVVFQKKG